MFDKAVSWLGGYVEAKSHEKHKKTHKPKWTLEQILNGDPIRPKHNLTALLIANGGQEITI